MKNSEIIIQLCLSIWSFSLSADNFLYSRKQRVSGGGRVFEMGRWHRLFFKFFLAVHPRLWWLKRREKAVARVLISGWTGAQRNRKTHPKLGQWSLKWSLNKRIFKPHTLQRSLQVGLINLLKSHYYLCFSLTEPCHPSVHLLIHWCTVPENLCSRLEAPEKVKVLCPCLV